MKLKWESCIKAAVTLFALYLAIQYWPVASGLISTLLGAVSPLLIGCIVAYLVNILMNFYEQRYFPKARSAFLIKSRRPVCMIAAFLTLLLVVGAVAWLVIPELISCVGIIITAATAVIKDLIDFLAEWEMLPETIINTLESIDWRSQIGNIINTLISGVGSVVDIVMGLLTSVFSGIVNALMAVIFAIYLLLGKDTISRQLGRLAQRYIKPLWYQKLRYVLGVVDDSFHRYIVGQLLEAVILGVLCTVGMWILRLPYASMIGVLVAVTALVPIAGAYIGGATGALMIFSVSPVQAIVFVVYLLILQQIEGNLIYPKVVGTSLRLPAIWVLAAVTIGGGVMGIAGMIIGVPIAAAAYRLLKEHMRREERTEIPLDEESGTPETES